MAAYQKFLQNTINGELQKKGARKLQWRLVVVVRTSSRRRTSSFSGVKRDQNFQLNSNRQSYNLPLLLLLLLGGTHCYRNLEILHQFLETLHNVKILGAQTSCKEQSIVIAQTSIHERSNKLDHHFSNIKRNRTFSSICN